MKTTLLTALLLTLCATARAENWEEKMYRQVNKKVTVEFVDTKLTDCLDMVSTLTGLNIIVKPTVRQANPAVNLKVQDMDAGTLIKWLTQLTETHAELKDQAIFITDTPDTATDEKEKQDLTIIAAVKGVQVDLPGPGTPLTNADRVQIALKLMEAERIKVQDFPGPDIGIGNLGGSNPFNNPFQAPGQ